MWHAYWNRAGVLKITSKDGSGEYMENLRNIYLFVAAAAEKGDEFPGTQAGVADMISSGAETCIVGIHRHSGIGTCECRSRQIWAGVTPGSQRAVLPSLRGNLTNIESWTKTT